MLILRFNLLNLGLEFIKRNINDSNLGVHGLTLLQNLIQGIPENNSSIIYNNPILKEVILQVLSIYNFHLLQPEIETIVKNIFNVRFFFLVIFLILAFLKF